VNQKDILVLAFVDIKALKLGYALDVNVLFVQSHQLFF
jgi:hypothetical protein